MQTNTKFIAAIVATALSVTALANIAKAESTSAEATEQAADVKVSGIKIPASGVDILDNVHGARLALFDGDIDAAKKLISDACDRFNDRAAEFAVKLAGNDGYAIPLESGIQFANGFEPDEAHGPVIAQADEQAWQGDLDGAVQAMSDAGIELEIKLAVLPMQAAADSLKQALTDIDADNIHAANMALKSVEISVVVEGFSPNALPSQGYPLNEILQS